MPSTIRRRVIAPLALALLTTAALQASDFPGLGPRGKLERIDFEPGSPNRLVGRNARQQLVVTGIYDSGQKHDLTSDVTWTVDQPAVLTVDEN